MANVLCGLRVHLWLAIWVLLAAQLHLCAAQTAYIVPTMQQDNPSNHSFRRLAGFFSDVSVLQQYDVIEFLDDYRVDVSVSLYHNK